MELRGNSPFLVFDDADLDEAIEGALIAKIRHGGEACIAADRFYIQRGIYDTFAKRLTERMGRRRLRIRNRVRSDDQQGGHREDRAASQ
jgi:succinate-semialdehyde dehydrogenase/glutarate-semialdehyde dehydrogenase